MPILNKLASNPVILSVVNYTDASSALVANELELIRGNSNICEAYYLLKSNNRSKSIIYKSIKGILKNFSKNKEDVEDVVSEALFLLHKSSLKYFEEVRTINFQQYAITFIRESIKEYRSKWNGLSGSDKNELIHTAIKIIKNKNYKSGDRLNYKEAKCLARHFNLCEEKGYKKIWALESLHYEKKSIWKNVTNDDGREEEIYITDNLNCGIAISENIKSYYNSPENISALEVNSNQEELEKNKKIFDLFKLKLNSNENLIFEKRMYCNKEDEIKLKEISTLLNISIQRVSKIENNIKKKLKNFYSVENKKITGIK
ncbi:sigma-70 family RNA polymerase sigma factor [Candidatus Pelagibacter sp.]|nr:sigma-70 family RNA polymerase sigma factor [Candidatus Pelagibacter sp.]